MSLLVFSFKLKNSRTQELKNLISQELKNSKTQELKNLIS